MTIFVIYDYERNEITFLSYPMTKYWRKSSKHNQHMSPEQPTHAIEKTLPRNIEKTRKSIVVMKPQFGCSSDA